MPPLNSAYIQFLATMVYGKESARYSDLSVESTVWDWQDLDSVCSEADCMLGALEENSLPDQGIPHQIAHDIGFKVQFNAEFTSQVMDFS